MPAPAAWLLLVSAVAGLVSAIVLTVEKIDILINPNYQPSCNINPILSCGSVMTTHQASAFGFPNPLLGIAGFAVVVTLGVLAVSGVALPRWVWAGLTLGAALGMAFVGWLIDQSLYRIGALCPYCMVVWTITPLILITAFNRAVAGLGGVLGAVAQWRWTLVAVYYAVVILLIYLRFQDRWDILTS
ncbi:MAG: vitamin K epoxide reductase family protein [Mycobacteriaceae bacterium]|nr:vitamin K epoxide reductase family protein [Mycobacteriaceae bacterium]